MKTVVVAHESYVISDLEHDAFRAIDATVAADGKPGNAEALEAARKADALMVTIQPVDAALIGSLSNCKIIARVGTGLDAIDIPGGGGTAASGSPPCPIIPSTRYRPTRSPCCSITPAGLQKMFASVKAGAWYDAAAIEPAPRLQARFWASSAMDASVSTVAAKARGLGLDVIVYDPFIEIDEARRGEAGRPGCLAWRPPISYPCTRP